MATNGDNGDNGTNNLSSRARAWFVRLSRFKKVLATSAALVITIGGVASAATSVLDLGERLGGGEPQTERVSTVKTSVQSMTHLPEGVRVTEVIPDSPAARAGVEVQDIVTDIDGKAIEDVDDFANALKRTRTGETLLLSIIRDSQRESVPVKLEPIEGTDLKAGVYVEDTVPQDTLQVLPISGLGLSAPETTIPKDASEPGPTFHQYDP
jgi:membrane-associated protease RseP (regulator of RpoE activity)